MMSTEMAKVIELPALSKFLSVACESTVSGSAWNDDGILEVPLWAMGRALESPPSPRQIDSYLPIYQTDEFGDHSSTL